MRAASSSRPASSTCTRTPTTSRAAPDRRELHQHGGDDDRRGQLRQLSAGCGRRARRGRSHAPGRPSTLRRSSATIRFAGPCSARRTALPTLGEMAQDALARVARAGGRRDRLLDRPAVRARDVCQPGGDRGAGAHRRPTREACTLRTSATRAPSSRRRSKRALRVAATTRARVQISHLKVDSPAAGAPACRRSRCWTGARSRGIEIMADQYAYTAASSSLAIRFPAWIFDGGEQAMAERLSSAGEWPRIRDEMRALLAERGLEDLAFAVVASYPADPSLNGLSMRDVAARLTGGDSADAQFEAARAMLLRGGASMVYHLMSEDGRRADHAASVRGTRLGRRARPPRSDGRRTRAATATRRACCRSTSGHVESFPCRRRSAR
jgi:hypothetical protein